MVILTPRVMQVWFVSNRWYTDAVRNEGDDERRILEKLLRVLENSVVFCDLAENKGMGT